MVGKVIEESNKAVAQVATAALRVAVGFGFEQNFNLVTGHGTHIGRND